MPSENWKEESAQINEIVDSFGVPLAAMTSASSQSQSHDLPCEIAFVAKVGTKAQLDQLP